MRGGTVRKQSDWTEMSARTPGVQWSAMREREREREREERERERERRERERERGERDILIRSL